MAIFIKLYALNTQTPFRMHIYAHQIYTANDSVKKSSTLYLINKRLHMSNPKTILGVQTPKH